MTKLEFSRYQLGVLKDMLRAIDSLSLHCSLLLKTVEEHTVINCPDSDCSCRCFICAPCFHCEGGHGFNQNGDKPSKDTYIGAIL